VFALVALICFYYAIEPVRKRDRATFPFFGIGFVVLAVLFAIPVLQTVLVPVFWFGAKVGFLLFAYIWVRGTLPRFRYDQLMHFAWTFLFPCALLNLLLTALLVAVF
jgi:NADH-quinone oxidoreductase subunit H